MLIVIILRVYSNIQSLPVPDPSLRIIVLLIFSLYYYIRFRLPTCPSTEEESDDSLTPEPTEEITLEFGDRQSPREADRPPTSPAEEPKDRTPTPPAEEPKDRIPTPPVEEPKDPIPTPPAEESKDRTPTPPTEEPKDRTPTPTAEKEQREQESHLDDTMPLSYTKYRDDSDAEAHVYAFLQTWEANHVSQRLTEAEAE